MHSSNPPPTREELCRIFIKRLEEGGKGIDLKNPEKWPQGGIIASGGAGNLAGSKVAIGSLARVEIEHVVDRLIWRLANEPIAGQSTFDRLFFESCGLLSGAANLGGSDILFGFGRSQKLITIILKYCYAWHWGTKTPSPAYGNLDWVERWSPFLHIPIDRRTLTHLSEIDEYKWLALSGTYLIAWKQFFDEPRHCRVQDSIRRLATGGDYDDPLHYEMDKIW